jgi:hypothetical protein
MAAGARTTLVPRAAAIKLIKLSGISPSGIDTSLKQPLIDIV